MEHDVEALKAEHARLEAELETAYASKAPDEAHIAELKRLKLRIKDQIALLGG